MTPHLPGQPLSSVPRPSLKGGCPSCPVLEFSPLSTYPPGGAPPSSLTPSVHLWGHLSPEHLTPTYTTSGHWFQGSLTDAADPLPQMRPHPMPWCSRLRALLSETLRSQPPAPPSPQQTNHRAWRILLIPHLPLLLSPFLQLSPWPGHFCLPLSGSHALLRELLPAL